MWCKRDTRGRLYPVNRNGERCARPNAFEESGGAYRDQRRPSDISPHVWWKMMLKVERLQWWADHLSVAPAARKHHDIVCSPMGISQLLTKEPKNRNCDYGRMLNVLAYTDGSDMSTDNDSASMPDLTSESDDEEPWNRWESFVGELGSPGETCNNSCLLLRPLRDPLHGCR